jgi:ABC-2 type transport system permease protein
MVSQFLQLKRDLLRNSLRRRPGQLGGFALAFVYAVVVVVFIVGGLVALRSLNIETSRTAVVMLGAVILCVYAVVPFTLGIDDALDPRKFELLGIPTTKLTANLAVSALIGLPSLFIVIIAGAQVFAWTRGPGPTTVALASAVLIVITAVLASRISASIAAFVLTTRRARDRSSMIGIILMLALAPVAAILAGVDWGRSGLVALGRVTDVIGWSPLGAAWAAPAAAAVGDTSEALVKLLIACAWSAVLFFVWRQVIAVLLITPERHARPRTYVGLGWFEVFPRTPMGVIAARTLTYWGRDSRYGASLAAIPFIPLVVVIVFLVAGFDPLTLALLPVPMMSLFLGWSAHNDVAHDNTALWLHLSTSTSGRADRWGRIIPLLWLGIPLLVLGSIVSALIFGNSEMLPALIGVSVCLFLSGLGISSITSAQNPYPAVRPGDSPFAQPQGNVASGTSTQSFSLLGIVVVTLPALAAAVMALNVGGVWTVGALGLGLVIGTGVLLVGVARGAKIYNRRTSELLEFSLHNQ